VFHGSITGTAVLNMAVFAVAQPQASDLFAWPNPPAGHR
jgi:hypothetical protein